eukprot:24078_6
MCKHFINVLLSCIEFFEVDDGVLLDSGFSVGTAVKPLDVEQLLATLCTHFLVSDHEFRDALTYLHSLLFLCRQIIIQIS